MEKFKPVSISKSSFAFCRISLAVLVLISFLYKSKILLVIVCVLFLLSAILKVKRAPMIRLFDVLFHGMVKRTDIMVDENAIYFAHILAFVLSTICLILVCVFNADAIWYSVLTFAILKTISACGFCPASKLYECTLNGNCCVNKQKNGSCPTC